MKDEMEQERESVVMVENSIAVNTPIMPNIQDTIRKLKIPIQLSKASKFFFAIFLVGHYGGGGVYRDLQNYVMA